MFPRFWSLALLHLWFATGCASDNVAKFDARSSMTLISNVQLVDIESGAVSKGSSILISDDTIIDVFPSGTKPPTSPYREFDANGMFAIPGLIDAHMHVFDSRDLEMARLHGVSVVRNMDGWEWHVGLKPHSPVHLLTTGKQFASDTQDHGPLTVSIAREFANGFDWVKLYDDLTVDQLNEIAAINIVGEETFVTGHLPDNLTALESISTGAFDDVAHAEELLQSMIFSDGNWRKQLPEIIDLMKVHDVSLTTTLANNVAIHEQARDFAAALEKPETRLASPLLQFFWGSAFNPYRGPFSSEAVSRLAKVNGDLRELVATLHENDIKILAGTDAPNPITVPGFTLIEELELLVEAGLTPLEALQTATSTPALKMRIADRFGSLSAGAHATFILTKTDPTKNIKSLYLPDAIIASGEILERDAIEQSRDLLVAQYVADLSVIQNLTPESAGAILNAVGISSQPNISEQGLTSLVWFYVKMGNFAEAKALSAKLSELYPESDDAFWVEAFCITHEQQRVKLNVVDQIEKSLGGNYDQKNNTGSLLTDNRLVAAHQCRVCGAIRYSV